MARTSAVPSPDQREDHEGQVENGAKRVSLDAQSKQNGRAIRLSRSVNLR